MKVFWSRFLTEGQKAWLNNHENDFVKLLRAEGE